MKSSFQIVVIVSFLLVFTAAAFSQDMLYWSNWFEGTIRRANQDGTGMDIICSDYSSRGRGIAINPNEGYIYWTDHYIEDLDQKFCQITRARLNGSHQTTLVEIQTSSYLWEDVVIDLQNNKLYWADDTEGSIYRSNLDGSGVEIFLSGLSSPHDIELDIQNNHIYWTSWFDGKLWRAGLDGANQTLLASYTDERVYHIALDIQNGHIYLSRRFGSTGFAIERMNLDGTNGLVIYVNYTLAFRDILINPANRRLYIACNYKNQDGYIASCKLDGTDFRYDISGLTGQPWGLQLGPGLPCQTPPQGDLETAKSA